MTRKKQSRQSLWQRAQLKKGRCRQCGRKRSKKSTQYCPTHHREHKARNREYMRRRAEAKK